PPRHRPRRRPGEAARADHAHRPHGLHERVRHRDGPRRPRAGAGRAGLQGAGGRGRGRPRDRGVRVAVTSVLVTEEIAQAGVDLLRGQFQVDVELNPKPDDLAGRIGAYDALIVRSATSVAAGLLEHAGNLKVIGRAGTGVDNVDVAAATRRGIIVANAPGSNMVAAAEHAFAVVLAIARNIPQAHAALTQGRWERKRFAGVELADKVLGIVGLRRNGQLVGTRARALALQSGW